MNSNPKSPKDVNASADKFETSVAGLAEAITALYSKGVERAVQLQKSGLTMAAQQNSEFSDACKKACQGTPAAPAGFLFDVAAQSFDRLIETQKSVIDQVLEQSNALLDYARQRGDHYSKAAETVTSAFQQSFERGLALQKSMLDFAAQQNRVTCDAVKRQTGVAGTPAAAAADSMQRGMDALIETQKELLEIAAKPLKVVSAKAS